MNKDGLKQFNHLLCTSIMEQTEEDTRRLPEIIVHTVVLALTTILAITGNLLVCLAFYRNRRLRTITNYYVLSLAIADIMLATCSPFHVIASGLRGWPFSYSFCQFTGFFVQFWAQVSLCILALASWNRYFCVVKPHKYPIFFAKKKTIFSIVFVWIFTFLQTLVLTIVTPVIYRWSSKTLYCQGTSFDERTVKITYIFFGCFFMVPMVMLIFCYGSVYRAVRRHDSVIVPSLKRVNGHGTITAQEIKASRVLFFTVLGFFVCWTPLIILLFLVFGFQVSISSVALWVLVLLSTFSSWINPVIYGIMNRAMRKEFRNILLCGKVD